MIKLIFLVISVIAKEAYCARAPAPKAIVGGDTVPYAKLKYQVSLQSYGQHFCGGSIISTRHILTAAHCVDDILNPNELIIVSGTNSLSRGGIKHRVKCIELHSGYTGEQITGWKDDIAIVTLAEPLKINSVQTPIPLASRNHVNGDKRGLASGWGGTRANGPAPDMLQSVSVKLLSQEDCIRSHSRGTPTTANQICTLEQVGKGICQGDSGGPLVVNGEVVGIASWNVPCAVGVSDVFTNVYKYRNFIKQAQSKC